MPELVSDVAVIAITPELAQPIDTSEAPASNVRVSAVRRISDAAPTPKSSCPLVVQSKYVSVAPLFRVRRLACIEASTAVSTLKLMVSEVSKSRVLLALE